MKSIMIAIVLGYMSSPAAIAPEPVVDLGNIKTVAGLLRQSGYKAKIAKAKDGSTYIESAANGGTFVINFSECKKGVGCESLQIACAYEKEPYFTPEIANEWNATRRFLKIAIDEDGNLGGYVDVSTVSHTTSGTFADYLERFVRLDGALSRFLEQKRSEAEDEFAPDPPRPRSIPI